MRTGNRRTALRAWMSPRVWRSPAAASLPSIIRPNVSQSRRGLRRGQPGQKLRHHGGRGLGDGTSLASESGVRYASLVDGQVQDDPVAAYRVVFVAGYVGRFQAAVVAGTPVVVQDDVPVKVVHLFKRKLLQRESLTLTLSRWERGFRGAGYANVLTRDVEILGRASGSSTVIPWRLCRLTRAGRC